jgi:hypothetical protein
MPSSTFWPSRRTPSATNKRQSGGAPVEANPHHRAVEDEAHDVVVLQVAPLPRLPIGLDLVPGPADHVLADRAAEQRSQRPPHPPRIGARKVGGGDQRLGTPGQPLVGWDRAVAPLRRPAGRPDETGARHRHRDGSERADQLTLTMAVTMPVRVAVPSIAATLQARFQFGLRHFLDEASNALANGPFQRVEPILTTEWLRLRPCGSLVHGVISWRLAGRLLGATPIRRLRRPQFPTTSETRPGISAKTLPHRK